jgi:hypothetical protein
MPRRLGRRLEREEFAIRQVDVIAVLRSVGDTVSRLAWHVVNRSYYLYNDGEYILVIKCIGYK